jgi:hypothetical protein|tara:strand:- start:267 stop:575 length:309 start_codon:yes stop_codon:yes gene_type:complete
MNNIDVLNTPIKATPPAKLVTDKKESKYDIFFSTALDSPNEWFLIASAPISARDTVYSTASAIRSGRLGNMPRLNHGEFEIIVRRVDENGLSFSNMYLRYKA